MDPKLLHILKEKVEKEKRSSQKATTDVSKSTQQIDIENPPSESNEYSSAGFLNSTDQNAQVEETPRSSLSSVVSSSASKQASTASLSSFNSSSDSIIAFKRAIKQHVSKKDPETVKAPGATFRMIVTKHQEIVDEESGLSSSDVGKSEVKKSVVLENRQSSNNKRTSESVAAKNENPGGGVRTSFIQAPRLQKKRFSTFKEKYDLKFPMYNDRLIPKYVEAIMLFVHLFNIFFIPLCVAWPCEFVHQSRIVMTLNLILDISLMCGTVLMSMFLSREDGHNIKELGLATLMYENLIQRKQIVNLLFLFPVDFFIVLIANMADSDLNCVPIPNYDIVGIAQVFRILRFIPMNMLFTTFSKFSIENVPRQVTRLVKCVIGVLFITHISACLFGFISSLQSTPDSWVLREYTISTNITSLNTTKLVYGSSRRAYEPDFWKFAISELKPKHGIISRQKITNYAKIKAEQNLQKSRNFPRGSSHSSLASSTSTTATGPRELLPFGRQYIVAFSAAQQALLFHPRDVKTKTELVYSVFETLLFAVVYGGLFANLQSVAKALSSGEEHKAEKFAVMKSKLMKDFMHKQSFPVELQEKIMSHQHFHFLRHRGMDEESLLFDLPPQLQQDIVDALYMDMVVKVPLFERNALFEQMKQTYGTEITEKQVEAFDLQYKSLIKKVTKNIRCIDIKAGWDIFMKGDPGSELFMIRKGKVDVLDGYGKCLVTLGEKNYFGEIALLEQTTRTATARAATDCELCVLNRQTFDELMNTNTILKNLVVNLSEKRRKEEIKKPERRNSKWNALKIMLSGDDSRSSVGKRPAYLQIVSSRRLSAIQPRQTFQEVIEKAKKDQKKLKFADIVLAARAKQREQSEIALKPADDNNFAPNEKNQLAELAAEETTGSRDSTLSTGLITESAAQRWRKAALISKRQKSINSAT
ncbi:hypothetical protein HK098_001731 [Nowakowskiella sp. JEL0407]|nr:hypothetical protein HK098_001731 [Nowakowskiella sp. JEL0407]